MLMVACPALAADIELEIDQETLSIASGLVTASGTAIHLLWSEQTCLFWVSPVAGNLPSRFILLDRPVKLSPRSLRPFLLRRPIIGQCKFPIGSMGWAWHVQPSQVQASASGLTLQGSLAVQFAQGSATLPFSFPISVTYNAQQKAVQLSLQQGSVDVEVFVGGQMRHLGTVDLAPHFATSLPLLGEIPLPSGGSVDVDLTNVQISTLPGRLRVSADVDFD